MAAGYDPGSWDVLYQLDESLRTSEEDANIADTDGTSSENARSTYGGGVYVGDGGSFVMTGGLIANNKATIITPATM